MLNCLFVPSIFSENKHIKEPGLKKTDFLNVKFVPINIYRSGSTWKDPDRVALLREEDKEAGV